jgi:hypothetical protein
MPAYNDLVHAAEMALARRESDGFHAAMDAAEASGMPRVDAMVLRLGAASILPTSDLDRERLAREYLTLAAEATSSSADPSVHDALSVVMRVIDVCSGRPALVAELGDELVTQLERISDDEPYRRDDTGAVVERARTYKATVHESIRQARHQMGLDTMTP